MAESSGTTIYLTREQYNKRRTEFIEAVGLQLLEKLRPAIPFDTGNAVMKTKGRMVSYKKFKIQMPKYMWYVEFGAQPHKIEARNKPYLRFFWKKMGVWMTVKSVNHPGNRPQPFIRHTINKYLPGIVKENYIKYIVEGQNHNRSFGS
jgi:hypothetical protein